MQRSRLAPLVSLLLMTMSTGTGNAASPASEQALQLEVFVNGTSPGLIGAFRRRDDGRLAVAPDELKQLGLKADARATAGDGLIELDRLPGLSYRLDTAAQVVRLTVEDVRRVPRIYD